MLLQRNIVRLPGLYRPHISAAFILSTDNENKTPISFSTTPQRQIFRKTFHFSSYLRRLYLKKRYGIDIVGLNLMKDGVVVDNEFAKLSFTTPAFFFKFERYWAAAMIPLIPAAYFIHSLPMDIALAIAIACHSHWGIAAVVKDYARSSIIGDKAAEFAMAPVTLSSIILFCGLLHFCFLDVGLTNAFELVFSL